MESLDYVAEQIRAFVPTADICLRATRHLGKKIKNDLFISEPWPRRNAEGYFYEALVYEEVLCIVKETDLLKGLVRKSADVPPKRPRPSLGQNGLFYDAMGAIVIRGHGQDLGEIDLILVDKESNPIFVEVLISKRNLRGFDKEIAHKKALLREILGKDLAPFLIVSPVDISRNSIIKRILKAPDNLLVEAHPLEKAKSLLDPEEVKRHRKRRSDDPNLIDLKAVEVSKAFDYEKSHNKARKLMFNVAIGEATIEGAKSRLGDSPIVSKAILGGLYPSAVTYLCRDKGILIRGKRFTPGEIQRYFHKVVLAIGLPDLRPVLYMKVRGKYLAKKRGGAYLKLGPIDERTFRFERNVPSFVGFYMWLDTVNPSLGANMTRNIVEAFVREDVIGSKKKPGGPNLKLR